MVKPYTSGLDRAKQVIGLLVIMILTWFLVTEEFVSAGKALQVITPTLTTVNSISFKGTAANASAVQTGTVSSQKINTASFKAIPIIKVATKYNIDLSSYSVIKVGGKLPQRILEATNSLNYKLSPIKPSTTSKILLSSDP